MKELARLENAYDISYELILNELWTCKFKLPKDDKKNQYCQPHYFVELFDSGKRLELFRILPSVMTRQEVAYIEYDCEHVLATLLDDVMFQYHQIGNLGVYTDRVIRYVLDQQTTKYWQLVDCEFRKQFEYKWENENLLASLFSIPKPFIEGYRWEFDTTSRPWGISLKKMETGYKADTQYKKNMQNIEKITDPTNLVTRLYGLGYGEGDNQLTFKSINNGKPYLEKNVSKYGLKSSILADRRFESAETLKDYAQRVLNDLSEPYVSYKLKAVDLSIENPTKNPRFMPGDNILVRDLEDDVNIIVPIIKVSKGNVRGNPFDVDLEVANKSKNVTGSISDLQERARINDTYAQGATNLMQMAFVDNADPRYPATFKFYIPNEMARINKLILNYTLSPFRAYSRATKGGGRTVKTTESGGGQYTSTGGGGGQYTSTGGGGGSWDTTHGMAQVDAGNVQRVVKNFQGIQIGYAEDYHVNHHEHKMEVPEHSHSISISDHSHSVSIKSHTHSFELPDHTHEIDYGMYEGGKAGNCYLKVDGKLVYNYAKELNIIPYLSKDNGGKIERGTWHEIEIVPDKLTRINASLFIQLFTNSRGGGDF